MRRVVTGLGLELRLITPPTVQREVVMVLHTGRSLSPAAQAFGDLLLAHRAAHEGTDRR